MWRARLLLLVLAMLVASPAGAVPQSITPQLVAPQSITLDQGRYLAVAPPDAAPGQKLPVTLFLHGVWSSPELYAAEPGFLDAFAADGVLLLMPAGQAESWSVPGAPRMDGRDDIAFLDAVLADAARRFPIDPARVRLAGFSLGASMAFHYACRPEAAVQGAAAQGAAVQGAAVQAVLTIGGVPWLPLPEGCAGRPLPWMHLHGTADPTWPIEGRAIRGIWRQAPVRPAVAMLARSFGCALPQPPPRPGPLAGPMAGPLAAMHCTAHPGCGAAAAELALCLHPGGHELDPAWIAAFHAWAEAPHGRP